MKKHYLFLLAAGALLAWHCGDDSNSGTGAGNGGDDPGHSVAEFPYFLGGYTIDPATGIVYDAATGIAVGQLLADGTVVSLADGTTPILVADTTQLPSLSSNGYLINKNGAVTDLNGTLVGNLGEDRATIRLVDGTVVDLAGNVISIPQNPDSLILSSAGGTDWPALSSSSTGIDIPTSSAGILPGVSSSFEQGPASSSSAEVLPGNVTGSLTQNVQKGQAIETVVFSGVASEPTRSWNLYFLQTSFNNGTYTISGSVPDYFQEGSVNDKFTVDGKEYTLTLNIGTGAVSKSSSSAVVERSSGSVKLSSSSTKSSSSVAVRSSSSVAKSSSSVSGGTTLNIKVVDGGKSGSGYATRYWDSCKPHCAWNGKGGPATTPTRTCHADGSLAGVDEKSACDGGTAGTCLSQIPQIISDEVAYAFAATPGGENDCGRCFMLTFTGEGKDGTNARSRALKGKKLIVISSNIGYDVAGGQFDIMIPGGGVGKFNGCGVMGLSCAGEQYGGLLATCEKAGGGDAKIKSCLVESCNREYASNPQAKEGCLFMATWMNAASTNPKHSYVEVECPAELAARW